MYFDARSNIFKTQRKGHREPGLSAIRCNRWFGHFVFSNQYPYRFFKNLKLRLKWVSVSSPSHGFLVPPLNSNVPDCTIKDFRIVIVSFPVPDIGSIKGLSED